MPSQSPTSSPTHLAATAGAKNDTDSRSEVVEVDSSSKHNSYNHHIPPLSQPSKEQQRSADASTRSVTTSVFALHSENGRTYHGYRAGSYLFPNDATEIDRLEYQHLLIHHCLQQKLFFAPIPPPPAPLTILDIGTGTGTWAIEMGDLYPTGQIEATDLSPIQPSAVPENVQFIIDDSEQADWVVPEDHYDYIHTRILEGCFENMGDVIKRAFRHTKPGGFLECQELDVKPHCDDDTMPPDWPFALYVDRLQQASLTVGRELDIAPKLRGWFEDAGFVDIQQRVFKAPLGRWPSDPAMKDLGHWWNENMVLGLQGFSLAYFTRVLDWTPEQIEVYLVNVRKSLADADVHAYHRIYVLWGRKPLEGEIP